LLETFPRGPSFDVVTIGMRGRRSWANLCTDIIMVGGIVLVLSVASTSAFFHWLDRHRTIVLERVTNVHPSPH
jgi:hypothetical protein